MKRLVFVSMWLVLLLAGCGGGGGSSGSSSQAGGTTVVTAANNVLPVTVNSGPTHLFPNLVLASVTVCVPGTSTCQTIPNVMVDTGSIGLRLLASAVTIPLPGVASASGKYAECVDFADGVAWGSLAQADVQLAGEKASAISVQLINDSDGGAPVIPTSCSNQGAVEDTQTALGVNGILGVGAYLQDCEAYCAQTADAIYYDCTAAGVCTEATIAVASQVSNPVAGFAQDNNGSMLQLAAIPDSGAASGTGNLVFGIGTQTNNQLGAAIIPIPASGYFTASFNGTTYANSFFDSGSTAWFFDDASITACDPNGNEAGFYCPGSASALSSVSFNVTLTGGNAGTTTVTGSVANAAFLFSNAANNAFVNLAGPAGSSLPGSFDFGVPFFFGRSVFTAIEGRSTPNGTGPFWAYQSLT